MIVAVGAIFALLLTRAGVPSEYAHGLIDQITEIAIWYLGAQGAVDIAATVASVVGKKPKKKK